MDLDSPAAFFRRLVGRVPVGASQDAADLGTAFGLEVSLGPVSTYPAREDVDSADYGADAPMNWLARRLRRPG
jgi:hypothetical protein